MMKSKLNDEFNNTLDGAFASAPPEPNVEYDCAPPPYYPEDINQPSVTNTIRPFNAALTKDYVRTALVQHVSKSCCMGRKAANKMDIKNIDYSFIHVLNLETFSERRQTSWECKAFQGGHIDDSTFGRPPDVWEVEPSKAPTPFKDGKHTCTIPHTDYIQSCHGCNSTGRQRCSSCEGQGSTSCTPCNNTGRNNEGLTCLFCNGRGRKTCFSCNSSGFRECQICCGSGKLKYFKKLKITWKNHIDEFVSEPNFIPKNKLSLVTGDVIFKDQAKRVYAINYVPLPDISQASQSLINKHEKEYLTKERPLLQQQTIQVIQVAAIHYEYNGKAGTFWLFGKEATVHCPEYPNRCCMCVLM